MAVPSNISSGSSSSSTTSSFDRPLHSRPQKQQQHQHQLQQHQPLFGTKASPAEIGEDNMCLELENPWQRARPSIHVLGTTTTSSTTEEGGPAVSTSLAAGAAARETNAATNYKVLASTNKLCQYLNFQEQYDSLRSEFFEHKTFLQYFCLPKKI